MKISMGFDVFSTFNCTYGISFEKNGELRVFVEKGLEFSYGRLIKKNDAVFFVPCKKEESESIENIFPVHYIFDQSRNAEYYKWELNDGVLKARTSSGEWVQYENKASSQYAMHEFVGGCWFVFEDVHLSHRTIDEYTTDRKSFTGNKFVQKNDYRAIASLLLKKYLLEGVANAPPGPGWMVWEIYAKNFHVEIPDK